MMRNCIVEASPELRTTIVTIAGADPDEVVTKDHMNRPGPDLARHILIHVYIVEATWQADLSQLRFGRNRPLDSGA